MVPRCICCNGPARYTYRVQDDPIGGVQVRHLAHIGAEPVEVDGISIEACSDACAREWWLGPRRRKGGAVTRTGRVRRE